MALSPGAPAGQAPAERNVGGRDNRDTESLRMQLSLVTSPLDRPRSEGGDPGSCPPPRVFRQDWGRAPPGGWGSRPIAPWEPRGRGRQHGRQGGRKVLRQRRARVHVQDPARPAVERGPVSNSACGPACPWPWGWAPACPCPAGPAARCARSPAGSVPAPPSAARAPAPLPT